MTLHLKKLIFIGFFLVGLLYISQAQTENIWTLDSCIQYAFSQNIQIQQAGLSEQQSQLNFEQAKASRLPSLSAGISKNFSWNKSQGSQTGDYGSLKGSNSTSYSLSSGIQVFNGMKLNNQVKQAELNLLGSQYYSKTIKESVELNILDAYLQILYAQEEVNNAGEQISSTTEQLNLAKERLDVGIISNSDFLQIKSQLASEKLTLANAKSTLTIAKVNLMQLMELPVNDSFEILIPDMSNLLATNEKPVANKIYQQALGIKPQIKEAALNLESVKLGEKIARAGMYPTLSMSAGLSSSWISSEKGYNYAEQLNNNFSPGVSLSLSVPIFQNKEIRTNIQLAQISTKSAQLDEIDVKNDLRKEIEQATTDYIAAQIQYKASLEQYEAVKESYAVVSEKYELGLINSVDFLIEKTDMITSESGLLQAKYNLIFSSKILDFYKGTSISLSN